MFLGGGKRKAAVIKIAFIAPDPAQIDLIYDVYNQQSRTEPPDDGDEPEYDFRVYGAAYEEDIPELALDSDIIIARGYVATRLKRTLTETAVVEVPVGSELVTTIYQAVNKYGRHPVGVCGSITLVHSAIGLGEVLGLDIKSYLLTGNNEQVMEEQVSTMLRDGRKILITGTNTYKAAVSRDCYPVLLRMSRDSIWQAIAEAKLGAVIKRRERERAEQFNTVLNNAYDGILATDAHGRISVFNEAARDILRLRGDGGERGGLAREQTSEIKALLRGNEEFTDKVIRVGGELLSVNKVAIRPGGDFSGFVFTVQRCSAVQTKEGNIRRQIYAKGHIARYTFDDVVGDSPAIRTAVTKASSFAGVTSNIAILGETGTGKEVFAQSIHNHSDRRAAPFVAINCAALSKSLLESELFGYVDGAFTGAAKGGKPGLFEIAHTGTIFLDEISEIPLDLQGRLLRVIQERQIMRLGDDKIIPIDVRIISASNKPLLDEVRRGAFRRDLYYRLNVLTLDLPSLNQRGADIAQLATLFLAEYCAEFGKDSIALSPGALAKMMEHKWEGNIRELRNVCEHLVVLSRGGAVTASDLDEVFTSSGRADEAMDMAYGDELLEFEKDRIRKALAAGGKTRAAKMLGMSRTTLWRRIREYGLEE